jgi:hypothetical protein
MSFCADPTPDPSFREVSAPTPDQDPVSDSATLVTASRGKLPLLFVKLRRQSYLSVTILMFL